MVRSIQEIEAELRKIIDDPKKEKVSGLPKEKTSIKVKDLVQELVQENNHLVQELVQEKSKKILTDQIVLKELEQGLRPVDIAKKYNCKRHNVTWFLNKLKARNLITRTAKGYKVKDLVQGFSLPIIKTSGKYQFQTIQITVPLKNPKQFDTIQWDKYIPEIKQSFKKYPYLAFTLNRTTKSIRLFLHSRYIDNINEIVKICKNYVNHLETELKKYDIEIDKTKARTGGLHLWKQDKIVEQEYDKSMGMIGVNHGVPIAKILPGDKVKERKTWIDQTPTPDGIESNDYSYFIDKETLEAFMKVPTAFIKRLDDMSEISEKTFELMNQTIQTLHGSTQLLTQVGNQGLMSTAILNAMSKVLERLEQKSDHPSYDSPFPPGVKEEYICPKCKVPLSPKAIVKRGFICPNCFKPLGFIFPEILQNKDKLL